jgi:hypothetical protein
MLSDYGLAVIGVVHNFLYYVFRPLNKEFASLLEAF